MPRLTTLEHRQHVTAELLNETARAVAEMRTEDEFARRLANEMRKRRFAALSTAEKLVLTFFASAPIITVALHFTGHG